MRRLVLGSLIGIVHFAAAQQPADSARLTTITYVAGSSVYVGAGRVDGVREGMSLDALRGGRVVATLRASFLASHTASCDVVSTTVALTVGDTIRFRPATNQAVASRTDSTTVQPQARPRLPSWRRPVRGRIGIGYMSVVQPNALGGATSITQPSAEVHVEGSSLAGGMVGFLVDARTRHTIGVNQPLLSPLDQRTLIYSAAISATHMETGTRLSVGRQYSAALPSVGLFDGATVELNRASWGAGVFSGAQPDVATMQFSSAVRETGAYVQLHSRADGSAPWSVSTGAIGSRNVGQLDREFGFMQFTLSSRLTTVYAMQEVDVNRGWKRAAGEPALTPTSTFASVSICPVDELSIQTGIDNRRNVRLYRDYVTPETAFDDAYREGIWGGASYSVMHRLRLGVDTRHSRGGAAGEADSYTGSFGLVPITPQRFDLRLRSTRYRTASTGGWLHALSLGAEPLDLLHLELTGGVRTQRLLDSLGTAPGVGAISTPNDAWVGVSADVNVGRSWYVLLSATRDNTGVDLTRVVYASVVFRF